MKCIIFSLTLGASLFVNACFAANLQQLPAHLGGRALITQDANGNTQYAYSWPAIYFETAFKTLIAGDVLTLKFDDDKNYIQLSIDNETPILIKKPGQLAYQIHNLKVGNHTVRLEKITETQTNTGRFLGFYRDKNTQALAMPKRKRSIEFIGDSFTVGYGNTSKTRVCTDDEVFATTHSQLAFGPLVAKHFNADYQINASSGFGMVRNYNGHSPHKNLISLYPFTLLNNHDLYANHWQPQIVVIGLGTNDFSTDLNETERWKTRTALQQDYINQYVHFVKSLHNAHPNTHFILMASDQLAGEIATQVTKVVATLKTDGMHNVDSIIFSELDYQGCHFHPSTKDHAQLADSIINHIQTKDIW